MHDAWSFCPMCGTDNRAPRQRQPVPSCHHVQYQGTNFCANCGLPLAQVGSTAPSPGPSSASARSPVGTWATSNTATPPNTAKVPRGGVSAGVWGVIVLTVICIVLFTSGRNRPREFEALPSEEYSDDQQADVSSNEPPRSDDYLDPPEPAADPVRGPRPKESAWDGLTPEVASFLRLYLRDPDSLDLIECSPVFEYGSDAWAQAVRYRARNGFGGMNVEAQIFVIKNGKVIDVIE